MIWNIRKRLNELEDMYRQDNSAFMIRNELNREISCIKEAISDYLGADFKIKAKLKGGHFPFEQEAVKTYELVKRIKTNKKK